MDIEISPFGLRSICIEPGYYRTKLIDPNNRAPYVNRIEGTCRLVRKTITAKITDIIGCIDYRESIGKMDDHLNGKCRCYNQPTIDPCFPRYSWALAKAEC